MRRKKGEKANVSATAPKKKKQEGHLMGQQGPWPPCAGEGGEIKKMGGLLSYSETAWERENVSTTQLRPINNAWGKKARRARGCQRGAIA